MVGIVVFGGFGLAVLVTVCIVADVVAGRARHRTGQETTIGEVTRVRGPLRGQLENGVLTEYVEVTVEYCTRHGEGPFEVHRRLAGVARSLYRKGDRVAVTYDVRAPRRARVTGRLPSVA